MNCIKCGAQAQETQVFCDDCLADMEKYPVKPDITVTLPHREDAPASKKKNRKQKTVSTEEQLRHAKLSLRLTRIALAVVFICFLLVAAMLLQYLQL